MITTDTPTPLTPAQESLYFLQQLTNGEPAYNMPQAFRIRGSLNVEAFQNALKSLVGRHKALRTTIIESVSGPVQVVRASGEICFRIHDLRSISESTLRGKLQSAVREPFDLARGPIFRVDYFRLQDGEGILLFNMHHIVGDMSSLGIIFRELAEGYAGVQLVPLSLGSYAGAQRTKEVSGETIEFWRKTLKNFTAELELPLDRFRPKYPSFRGAAHYVEMPAALRSGIGELARKNRSSLYMVCLAALEVLLFRNTGQQRFTIATPFTDRDDPNLEHTVGYLINLLPIACDLRPESTFLELLGQVRGQCLEVYGHHEISFRRIVHELGISSESPKPPLTRVVFQYFPEIACLELKGLECEPIRVHSETSKFDLCLSMFEANGKLTTEFEYDTDLYNRSTIERFARHLQTLLEALVEDPVRQIGKINLIDAKEKRLIEEWSGTAVPYPREKTIHALFEEQVKTTPTKTALRFEDQEISYEALDRRANQIAALLRHSEVKNGDFVGICLDRSPDLIAALIGILKAGAAFVPLEASYPKPRLDYLFEDSGVNILVTHSKYAHIAPAATKTILLDQHAPAGEYVSSQAGPETVAYMMYTSGSTGDPKGAMIPHRAVVRLVKNNDYASFGPSEVFLAFAPVSFDASTLEIWGPLLNGGTLAIYPPQFESVEQFEEALKKHKVTTLWLTAGLFNTVVDRKVEALRSLRQLLVGGDVLSVAHIRKALAALPTTELINGYGPTENTTFTCCYRIPREIPADRSIPIGHPIKNTTVRILDERMQPVPVGVPGDLYAGGDGLSLGYWRKPELTKQSFISDPIQTGHRLYRTGDRARFLDDGTIEFLGRRDSQVKVRGFRIEIEEVEAAFRKLPSIRDVAVAAVDDSSGGKSLFGYVVLNEGFIARPAEIQAQVAELLPAHACPSRIIQFPELPLGPNGKVDRTALPSPTQVADDQTEIASATNAIETTLVQLWQQILEVPALSIDDNFFHLGGESLRATRAISQMNAAFNCRLTLPRLFEAPTIRQIAKLVESCPGEPEEPRISRRIPNGADQIPDISRLSDQDVDTLLSQLLAADDSGKK